ncbi:LRR receptor-like serine/threonine-protein kinase [Pyrus ussuriensis x Pyrus communis]|uniref:LRR receptor-like serine/threonine-protein kinase n=1 Tax=Pyrus ussuriensis x Pyrus communis TaxID=2448454 RepID=A0A5N5FRW7_9ROSA|nr:LRR receptor-like serine/threonine-protein kinase [Pyrus ussuriensis x Pyrus communis]
MILKVQYQQKEFSQIELHFISKETHGFVEVYLSYNCPNATPATPQNKQDIFPWRKVLISIACGSGIGVILLLCFVLLYPPRKALRFVLLYLSRKARSKLTLGSSWEVSLLKVSYGDLLKATNGFSSRNLIGAGSFGSNCCSESTQCSSFKREFYG